MKKTLLLIACYFLWASICLAEFPEKYEKSSIYWTTSGDGPSNSDDGSVEINLDRVETKSVIQREPEFRNKVDEAIYRAKKNKY